MTRTPQQQKMPALHHSTTFWMMCELQKQNGWLKRVHERIRNLKDSVLFKWFAFLLMRIPFLNLVVDS
jgi:hypothetical protein